jgi:hypothetical protein
LSHGSWLLFESCLFGAFTNGHLEAFGPWLNVKA